LGGVDPENEKREKQREERKRLKKKKNRWEVTNTARASLKKNIHKRGSGRGLSPGGGEPWRRKGKAVPGVCEKTKKKGGGSWKKKSSS